MEYADVVFSFDHVFWINGKSPCFARDLDRGIISSSLTAADASSFLAVVEDVPPLDATRAAALSGVFDELLGRGCEVLATCAPSCDAYGPLQHDRLKLSAADLLLSDAELDAARPADDRASRPAAAVPPAERVPGLVWGPLGGEGSFLEGALREELPADMLLAMATMLVLGRGSLPDVEAFGPCGEDLAALMATGYPYLGIDRRCDRFETPCFPVEAVAGAVGSRLDVLAARSHLANRDALAGRWADVLLSAPGRACLRPCGGAVLARCAGGVARGTIARARAAGVHAAGPSAVRFARPVGPLRELPARAGGGPAARRARRPCRSPCPCAAHRLRPGGARRRPRPCGARGRAGGKGAREQAGPRGARAARRSRRCARRRGGGRRRRGAARPRFLAPARAGAGPCSTTPPGSSVFVNKEIDISLCRFSTLRWQAPTHLPS